MSIWELVGVALQGLVANRLRSALTMLGVIFGVGAVIAAVSMTQGAQVATMEQFQSFGTNVLTVRSGQWSRGPVHGGMGSENTLTYEDAKAIAKECPSVVGVAPEVGTNAQVKVGNANTNTRIVGTGESYPQVRNVQLAEGTFFTDRDVQSRRKVAVLGPTAVENLFGPGQSVVGRRLKINGMTFSITGQLKSKGDTGGERDQDDRIIVPITTAMYRLIGSGEGRGGNRDSVRSISVQFRDIKLADRAQGEIEAVLRQRHKIGPASESDFRIMSAADLIEGAQEASRIMTLLFGSIAAVSLLVGGIGIMNIMLVSVTERTREIGLRKAVGGTPRDILLQFLIEALTLSLLGGAIGVALGIGLAYFLRTVGMNTAISLPWVVVAFSFAAGVGILFGFLPSRKAASLDPIEALRYE
jgi:putative ABC transport system permease protein